MSVETPIAAADNWFCGEDRVFQFVVKDAAGVAKDINGWAITFSLRDRTDGTLLLSKSVGSGITLTTPANGVLEVAIARGDTIDGSGNILINPGRYVYALQRTDAGSVTDLAFGDAVLRLAASR